MPPSYHGSFGGVIEEFGGVVHHIRCWPSWLAALTIGPTPPCHPAAPPPHGLLPPGRPRCYAAHGCNRGKGCDRKNDASSRPAQDRAASFVLRRECCGAGPWSDSPARQEPCDSPGPR